MYRFIRFWPRAVSVVLVLSGQLMVGSMLQETQARDADHVINLWPAQPPGPAREVGAEQDFTKDTDRLIAGRRIIKLGNVSTPQAHVFLAPADNNSGASVVICPGGGFSILAWDLEGTEVAEWLNSIGVTAVVVKYRVPTRDQSPKWLAPVQDAQRAISLTRHNAGKWKLNPSRVAILGFSAGGETAAMAALSKERRYEAIDDIDKAEFHANSAALIYPGGLLNADKSALGDEVVVDKDAPPMFIVHAFDDGVPPEASIQMMTALKKAAVPSELHLYNAGGHGYGLREVDKFPVTTWPARYADWLRQIEWIK